MFFLCYSFTCFSLLLFELVSSEKLPDDFKKCSMKDTECLKDAIQDALPKLENGIPNLGVPSLDPLYIGEMVIGAGANAVDVVQRFENAELIGLSKSKINDLMFDIDKGKISIKFIAPVAHLNTSYKIDGKILVLPIVGHGQGSLKLEGFQGDIEFDVEIYSKRNEKYLRAKKFTFEIVLNRVVFYMDNLFDGNKLLADNMLKVLNDNWEPLYKEVIAKYAAYYGKSLTELMNKLFAKVPISELFLD
ncbi:protein takeout-like [Harmonia axyridis]|uniref:protein takeout-like n=1 Tax=Harmonia axyridis TaxID=115357 RepID=UPI001E278380|nr:protein takeout-like [Harmonia axyridis]